jgi:hypothetical protein
VNAGVAVRARPGFKRVHDFNNTFARTPHVKFIFSHAGGTVPYLAGRFGIVDEMRVIPAAEARATAAETFRRLYWDTALSWSNPAKWPRHRRAPSAATRHAHRNV